MTVLHWLILYKASHQMVSKASKTHSRLAFIGSIEGNKHFILQEMLVFINDNSD